jgi:RNA polymerase sigma-70 factor (ECF subfamily)
LFSAAARRHRFQGSDLELVDAIREGHTAGAGELFDRYGPHIQRVLANIMGFDPDLADLLQEVFVRALGSIHSLNDGAKLKAWLTSIAVYTARGCIRARCRRRWLGLATPEQVDGLSSPDVPQEVREALRCTYDVLARLPANERIAFTLRHVNGMELTEVAEACGVSLATIKRRLVKARQRFTTLARHRPALRSWLEEGDDD